MRRLQNLHNKILQKLSYHQECRKTIWKSKLKRQYKSKVSLRGLPQVTKDLNLLLILIDYIVILKKHFKGRENKIRRHKYVSLNFHQTLGILLKLYLSKSLRRFQKKVKFLHQ